MKRFFLLIALLIVFSTAVSAQIVVPDEEVTTCGDGVRQGHEMCEPDTDQDLCEEAGKILGIVMACDPRDCTCVPDRTDCGNEIREGSEFCDPGEKENQTENDFCDELGALFNETFTCDPDSCLCKPETAFGVVPQVCGDGNITGTEECESDEDCRQDQYCSDCNCVIIPRNVSEQVQAVMNETAQEELEEKEEKKEAFDYHDLVGVVLPGQLKSDFEEEMTNVHVAIDETTEVVVGVTTMHGVVQEITDDGLEDPSFDAYVTQKKADEIIKSENRTQALLDAVDEGEITYHPKGFFKRIVFWFKSLFR